jgi:hypothetical protein
LRKYAEFRLTMRLHSLFPFWLSPFIGRKGQRAFWCPAESYPHCDGLSLKSSDCRPFGDSTFLALKFNEPRTALVHRLLRSRGPLAVVRGVAFVVVFPFKAMSSRGLAHIFVKLLKIHPSWANGNPAPAIVGIRGMRRVSASSQHGAPRFIRLAVGESVGCNSFPIMTAAAFSGPLRARHISPRGNREIPTVALTTPKECAVTAVAVVIPTNGFHDDEAIKPLADNIGSRLKFVRKFFWGKVNSRHLVISINLMFRGRWAYQRPLASFCLV